MAYGVIWSACMKLPGPRAFRTVIMAAVMVVIIATRQVIGASSLGDVVLMLLVGDAGSSLSGSLDGSDGSFDSSNMYAR